MNCELCGRDTCLTDHHLIPRAVHGKKKFIREYGKEEMRSRILKVCQPCHSGIHDLFDEKELAESYATKDLLISNERMARHIKWVKKQK